MKSINLSYNNKKDERLDKDLNSIFIKNQKKFGMLVSKAIQQETKNICLWLSSPISRITMESKLYYNYCVAIFIIKFGFHCDPANWNPNFIIIIV